jgi:rod shape-determining protein MreB and related proteins
VFERILSTFRRFWGAMTRSTVNVALDLGSANTSIYLSHSGIVLTEPTYLANDTKNERVIAIGQTARQMIGRTPEYIRIVKPLASSVMKDPVLFEIFLKHLMQQAYQKVGATFTPNSNVVASLASNATQIDSRSLEQSILKIGARKVYLLTQLYAAVIGSRINFRDIKGQMLVILGDNSTEIGVFSLGKLVFIEVLPVSGLKFTQNVVQILRNEFNLLIGQNTAEECKIRSLAAMVGPSLNREKQTFAVRGRDLNSGLPKTINIDQSLIHESIAKDLVEIANSIKKCLESLPPEIAVDIHDNGVHLCGGGALIAGLDDIIARLIETSVIVVSDPSTAVIRGCGAVVENISEYLDILQDFSI